jgi:ketosteroid isomerase-like protein
MVPSMSSVPTFHEQISARVAKLVRDYKRRDASACASHFTEVATLLISGYPTARGRAEIASVMQTIMDAGHDLYSMQVDEAKADEKFGYALVSLMSTRGAGQVLLVCRRDAGQWLIHSEAVVRD